MRIALDTLLNEEIHVPVAPYLAAIGLQLGRAKDYQRVDDLVASGACTVSELVALAQSHQLMERWEQYVQRFT
jgi:hypothetical protein